MNIASDMYSVDTPVHDFIFNRNNATDFNLLVVEYPSIPSINEEIEEVLIPNRSSSLTIRKNEYRDREIKFKLRMVDIEYFWEEIDAIKIWLSDIKDNKLYYDREDRYFVVKRVIVGNIFKELKMYGEFEISFIVKPFLVGMTNSKNFLENNFVIKNQGNFEVNPLITLYGNGNLQLTINDETLTINNVVNQVNINSHLMDCTNADGSNKLMDTLGNFPTLKVGDNNIVVSENVVNTTIKFDNLYR
ncbi:hypothetical protein [Clostridium sp. UBA7791]|uniref:hypothetical protein n=1 Tax=Clostridium sp. UBA7791 TaxID=1946379 RepID=UPI0032166F04